MHNVQQNIYTPWWLWRVSQTIAYGYLSIIEDKPFWDAKEVVEHPLLRFKEGFQVL
jgi:hypothetical protein